VPVEWTHPGALWLLALLPVLAAAAWWRLRQRARLLAGFAEDHLLPRLAPDVDHRRRHLREGVRLAACALLIVALAGPQWGMRWEEVRREGVDLIVAVDTSRSMLTTDIKPSRIERAKLAVLDLVKQLQGDRLGLVAFAGTAFLTCPLTLDYGAFTQSLNAVHVGLIPRGGTALGEAIRTSLEAFEARQGKHEALILITDGENHEGDVDEAAQLAGERGVKIYTVGIGTTEGELIPAGDGDGTFVKDRKGQVVKSRLNEEVLQNLAIKTGGAYVHGTGASLGLEQIFQDHIAKMEKRELQSSLQRRLDPRLQWPLAAAILLIVVEPLLGDRRRPAGMRRRAAAPEVREAA
jgi:Ca-activated chloride channel family protein